VTEHKHLKQLVRARMTKTGESYATARRQLIQQGGATRTPSTPPFYFPGSMPGPTALRTLLAGAGVRAPHTGAPFTEAMVFGLAGGIGAGMFTFHYAKENFSSFFVAGRHLWHDHAAWALAAVKRLGLTPVVRESSGIKPGEKQLRELLEGGRPVMAWITLGGRMYHLVTVHGIDASGAALVGDLGDTPVAVPLPALAEARARVKKDRNRLLALEPVRKAPDLAKAVRGGIAACAESLAKGRMKNFTLEAFATWADRMDGSQAPDAWEKIFPPGRLLYTGLRSIAEYVEYAGTGGGLCRPMFADFLAEAAGALGDGSLTPLADRYAALGRGWTDLARAALPDDVPAFREARELLERGAEARAAEGEDAGAGMDLCARMAAEAGERMKSGFPLDAAASAALRRDLQRRVRALHDEEKAALAALGSWL
jgi:hypothetical protein